MSDKSDSSLVRMLRVLDLFTDQRLVWSIEGIGETLQVSLPTSYRYVKVLTEAGLLQRTADSQYTLGPRIIVLDHYIRQADPFLKYGVPLMKELVGRIGIDCVASALHGQQLLDIHREFGASPASLSYGRGRPRPLFLGAAPKVILAAMAPAALHKLLDNHAAEVAAAGLPADWSSFRRYFSKIRKTGYYFSNGELEPDLAAIAAPVHYPDGRVLGAISLVTTVQRMGVIDFHKLAQLLLRTAKDIGTQLP